mmetsp:Transcript_9627/g.35053  ORF Transcript_9627/g.35053 Transcript_9627/m.35053 type:complete len:210 (-) Transcript_9627:211-840(-)
MISAATVAKSKYLTVPSYGDISASAATHTSCERDRFTSCDSVTYARHALTSEKCSRPLPSGSAARNVSTSIFVIPSTLCSASFSSCLFFARSTRTSKHTGANSLYSINPSWFASASESSRFISLLFSPTFASLSALSNSVGSNAPLPSVSHSAKISLSISSSSSFPKPFTNSSETSSFTAPSAFSRFRRALGPDFNAPMSSIMSGRNSA